MTILLVAILILVSAGGWSVLSTRRERDRAWRRFRAEIGDEP